MSDFKKSSFPRQSSYNSLYVNPLNEIKHNRSCSEGGALSDDKENATPNKPKNSINGGGKENEVPSNGFCNAAAAKQIPNGKSCLRDRALKPSSLQLCMQQNDPNWTFGSIQLSLRLRIRVISGIIRTLRLLQLHLGLHCQTSSMFDEA
ncbi:hypothetical protein RHGRI_035126 [Rhododendron griersonianum]|uniref:Uncharacterized protein n=1 Tax=Rhododendron griersonianum TaxID=479676 RepID=A0AAV6I3R9_9ERIC|nr:hypothetical protein RHGRI_035126 [Rhododendron griersonianum]